jgi:hypothetical protein
LTHPTQSKTSLCRIHRRHSHQSSILLSSTEEVQDGKDPIGAFFRRLLIITTMMMAKLAIASLTLLCGATAFSPGAMSRAAFQQQQKTLLFSSPEEDTEESPAAEEGGDKVANVNVSPFEAGSDDELMYVLGVNLARQLGDIRPLVESGDELTKVAKGLLDTVIGRLTDDGQRALLASRGKDLNALITERA